MEKHSMNASKTQCFQNTMLYEYQWNKRTVHIQLWTKQMYFTNACKTSRIYLLFLIIADMSVHGLLSVEGIKYL